MFYCTVVSVIDVKANVLCNGYAQRKTAVFICSRNVLYTKTMKRTLSVCMSRSICLQLWGEGELGVWGTEVPRGSRGRAPGGGLGASMLFSVTELCWQLTRTSHYVKVVKNVHLVM